ncbi:hypothetical protein [Lactiplantibacillus mudanjiangensis]
MAWISVNPLAGKGSLKKTGSLTAKGLPQRVQVNFAMIVMPHFN